MIWRSAVVVDDGKAITPPAARSTVEGDSSLHLLELCPQIRQSRNNQELSNIGTIFAKCYDLLDKLVSHDLPITLSPASKAFCVDYEVHEG